MTLHLVPITISDAKVFVEQHHRHHRAPRSALFAVAAADDHRLVGVAIIGRPTARHNQDGWTAEVTRLTTDGTHNACSMLYAAAWRACRALGYRRLITYTLATEPGTSLRAAGWRQLYTTKGGSWNCPSRPRTDKHPTIQKTLWEAA